MADVGASTTAQVVGKLEEEATSGGIEGGPALTARLTELLAGIARPQEDSRIDLRTSPRCSWSVASTAPARRRRSASSRGTCAGARQTVLLGAADTFRAAAVEQLEEWARRAGCEFVKGPPDSDPGSVAFDAVKRGVSSASTSSSSTPRGACTPRTS